MKKTIFTVAIFVTGLLFAEIPKDKNLKCHKNDNSSLKVKKDLKVSVRLLKPQVWIAETSCGVTATTTQDWTAQQANEWRDKIEENYCKAPVYDGSNPGSLALN